MAQPAGHQLSEALEGAGDGVGVPQVLPAGPHPALREPGAVQIPGQSGHAPFNVGEDVSARAGPLQNRGRQAPRFRPVRAVRQLVGILPQPGQQAPARAAAEGYAVPMKEEVDRALLHPPGLSGRLDGQLPGPALLESPAEARRRALFAQGRAVGQTDSGPQLHERLIEVPRGVQGNNVRQDGGGPLFRGGGGDVAAVPGDPGAHPEDVSVHRRDGQAEGDGGDGTGGVVSYPGQRPDILISIWEYPAVIGHDLFGRFLQISGPAVVTQPLPQLHQPVLRQGGQIGHAGGRLQKTAVVVQHRRHPGLLEHDLRNPDVVRGGVAPPGKGPGVLPIPDQQGDGQLPQFVQSQSPLRFVLSAIIQLFAGNFN